MMFTEKEIASYQSIKAPDELLFKIKRRQKLSYVPVRVMASVAAIFIFFLAGIYFYSQRESDIIVSGQPLQESVVFYDTSSAMERTVSSEISFPIEIDPVRRTRISVTKGKISIDGKKFEKEVTISSHSVLWWEIEPEEKGDLFQMCLEDEKGVQKVNLKYEDGKITVTKEKK